MSGATNRPHILIVLICCFAAIAGCDRKNEAAEKSAVPVVQAAVLPAGMVLNAEPADATMVAAVKKTLEEGEPVVIEGIIGGAEKPFAFDRASFTLLDPSAQTCDKMAGHACATPWDACCDPDLPDRTLKVRLVGADGSIIAGSLEGVANLKPMRQVVVVGSVHKNDDAPGFLIDAIHLYVKG